MVNHSALASGYVFPCLHGGKLFYDNAVLRRLRRNVMITRCLRTLGKLMRFERRGFSLALPEKGRAERICSIVLD